jgi:hypothetical protein
MTRDLPPGLPGSPSAPTGDRADLPWSVRLAYDVLGLHPGGEIQALRERSAELRARRQAGERGLKARIAAIDAKIDAKLLGAEANRRNERRPRTVVAVTIVSAAVLAVLLAGSGSSTPLGLFTISLLAGGRGARWVLQRRRGRRLVRTEHVERRSD